MQLLIHAGININPCLRGTETVMRNREKYTIYISQPDQNNYIMRYTIVIIIISTCREHSGYGLSQWGFYKIWSTRPSPRPNLRARNCPLSVMGVKVSLVCSNSTVFSPHGYIFPIRWSNQLNQSERLIYAPLAWITTDPGNGLVSSLCQAIAWTNFDL